MLAGVLCQLRGHVTRMEFEPIVLRSSRIELQRRSTAFTHLNLNTQCLAAVSWSWDWLWLVYSAAVVWLEGWEGKWNESFVMHTVLNENILEKCLLRYDWFSVSGLCVVVSDTVGLRGQSLDHTAESTWSLPCCWCSQCRGETRASRE